MGKRTGKPRGGQLVGEKKLTMAEIAKRYRQNPKNTEKIQKYEEKRKQSKLLKKVKLKLSKKKNGKTTFGSLQVNKHFIILRFNKLGD
jgi:ubiquinone biosynthesis protein Coq4